MPHSFGKVRETVIQREKVHGVTEACAQHVGIVGLVGTVFGGEQFLEVAGEVKPGALETDACKEMLPDGIFTT